MKTNLQTMLRRPPRILFGGLFLLLILQLPSYLGDVSSNIVLVKLPRVTVRQPVIVPWELSQQRELQQLATLVGQVAEFLPNHPPRRLNLRFMEKGNRSEF